MTQKMALIRTILAFAFRDLRGGFQGFRVMALCLALGVGSIAAIGSFTAAVRDGIARDARILLGGDLDLRLIHRVASKDQKAWLSSRAKISAATRMRVMAERITTGRAPTPAGRKLPERKLVELKAVDAAYPLFGKVRLAPAGDLHRAIAQNPDGSFGAVAVSGLTARLGIKPGDRFRIGKAVFVLKAQLLLEPDRGSGLFRFGPRVMVSQTAMAATGLVQPGSLIRYHTRVKFKPGTDGQAFETALLKAFPDAGWRLRNTTNAAPRIQRFLDRAALFFTLISLTALLVGGIGVACAVTGYLGGKRHTIATFKCLGATGDFIFAVFTTEIAIVALAGILAGLVAGAMLPVLTLPYLAGILPVTPVSGIFPPALITAAIYGVAVTILFSLWPLAQARTTSAASLLRGLVSDDRFRPGPKTLIWLFGAGMVIAGLAYATAIRPRFAVWFILGTLIVFPLFHGLGLLLQHVARLAARKLARCAKPWPRLNLALANVHRPGAPTPTIVLAFGVALTLFVTLIMVEGNLRNQISHQLPTKAPAYFFIDIQPGQVAAFEKTVRAIEGTGAIQRMPTLRGRIIAINDAPVTLSKVRPGTRWVVRGDRGLTYTDAMPEGTEIVTGKWWPKNYKGPALMSIAHQSARGLGIGIGDTVTLNILGRKVTARIQNTRRVDWARLGLNFTMILSPGILDGAPHTHVATVNATPKSEAALVRAISGRFDNITAIGVREALQMAAGMLDHLAGAARATNGLTLMVGMLVLAGAIGAGRRERVRDAVILKVTGAKRRDLGIAYIIEYGIAGGAAALLAAILGTGGGYFILTRIMDQGWVFLGSEIALTVIGAACAITILGFIGTWRALAQKPAVILRDDRF